MSAGRVCAVSEAHGCRGIQAEQGADDHAIILSCPDSGVVLDFHVVSVAVDG